MKTKSWNVWNESCFVFLFVCFCASLYLATIAWWVDENALTSSIHHILTLSLFPPFPVQSFSSYCSWAPPTERRGHIHMSHRFTEIPIVFSQCAPLRGSWVACASQHGLIYPNSAPHYFTHPSHTMPHMQPHSGTSYVHICIGLCTLSHTVMLHLNLTMDHQQTVQYASPGGPLQTCFIIWPALSIVSASFDKFTSNWYNASVFLLEEDNCLYTEGPGP